MISPRRAQERFHDPRFGPKLVMTFDPRAPGDRYGALAWLNDGGFAEALGTRGTFEHAVAATNTTEPPRDGG